MSRLSVRSFLSLRAGLLAATVLAAGPVLACYSVYDASGQLVHRAPQPPSSATEAVAVPPGGRVAINGLHCIGLSPRDAAPIAPEGQVEPLTAPSARGAPLLTSQAAAVAAGARHAVIAPGIVAVSQADAEQVWAQAPLAAPKPAVAEQVFSDRTRAARQGAMEVVITEWADGRTDVERRPRR